MIELINKNNLEKFIENSSKKSNKVNKKINGKWVAGTYIPTMSTFEELDTGNYYIFNANGGNTYVYKDIYSKTKKTYYLGEWVKVDSIPKNIQYSCVSSDLSTFNNKNRSKNKTNYISNGSKCFVFDVKKIYVFDELTDKWIENKINEGTGSSVKVDGSSIKQNDDGTISVPTASTTQAGTVKVDGKSITIDKGVISAKVTVDDTKVNTAVNNYLTTNGVSASSVKLTDKTSVEDNISQLKEDLGDITGDKLHNSEEQTGQVLILDKSKCTQGYAADVKHNGAYSASNWYLSDFIEVNEDDVININLAKLYYLTTYDADKNIIDNIGDNTNFTNIEVNYTIPSGVSYIRVNIYKDNYTDITLSINDSKYKQGNNGNYSIPWLVVKKDNLASDIELGKTSKWKDKNMIMFGDSIVQDVTNSGGGYVTRLKTILGLNIATNKGISGRPMANGSANGDGTNTTVKTVTDFSDYDLLLIAAGTNDFKLNIKLGELGVIGDTEFDTNTFYGAYRDTIEYILGLKPTLRICLFTPLQRDNANYDVNYTNSAGYKLEDYVNAIQSVGAMYGIPVLDLYRKSGVTKLTMSTFLTDGLHPNSVGYDYIVNNSVVPYLETI